MQVEEQHVERTRAPPKPPRLKQKTREETTIARVPDTQTKTSAPTEKKKKHLHFQSPLIEADRQRNAKNVMIYARVDHDAAAQSTKEKNKRLALGCTRLMFACQNGDADVVLEQLRSKPESVHQRDSSNKNALHYCAAQRTRSGDLVAAASIAIAAPELLGSADEDGFTPLHLAVIQGNLAMVNLLLANKADVNAVDNEGHSVVHWATVCGEVEALRAVLAAGANVATPDINGGSPLHYAAQMCGANYDGKLGQTNSTKLALEILGILLAHPHTSVDVQDKDGRQPLLWAASAGSAKAVIALVKAGARVESADKDGLTALHCAASRGHTECIDTLISLCGAPTDLIDSNGCTALHYAVTLGHADATSRLLDLEADPNRQDRKGRTPAHCGCSKGQFETVKLLKERGANLWLRNAKGDLPVHEAASSGRRELVEWLLEQRPKQVNTTSNDGRSMLHIAAANDLTDMCKMLLDYGADVNAIYRNSKGMVITPLDCALQRGHRSTAKFLQSNGGLPSGKLRLAARRSNPFQEASSDVVRPLKYVEKEELHDLQNSKKYVVYLKRSDSDAAGDGEGSCSCTEQTYKKEQRYAHTCRRHRRSQKQRMRRRTSSCGEPKEICIVGDSTAADICRSKSNIELRRRKSRERYASSSDLEEYEDGAEDSCENCCYHKHQKQRVIKRRSMSLRRSKDRKDTDREERREQSEKDSSPERPSKRTTTKALPPVEKEVKVVQEEQKTENSTQRPNSKTGGIQSRPASATKRATPPASAGKEGTFIKSPPQSAKIEPEKSQIQDIESHVVEFTDEEDHAGRSETVVTQVDVHRDADETSLQTSQETEAVKPTVTEEMSETTAEKDSELKDEVKKEVEEVLQSTAATLSEEIKPLTVDIAVNEGVTEKVDDDTKKKSEEKSEVTDKKEEDSSTLPNLIETPATPMPTPIPSPTVESATEVKTTDSAAEKEQPAADSKSTDLSVGAATNTATAQIPISKDVPLSTASKKPITAPEGVMSIQREQESRRSFTLLPSDSAEDEAAEQTVRKSSFQVLKSDESVGELEDVPHNEEIEFSDTQVFKIMPDTQAQKSTSDVELSSVEGDEAAANYDDQQSKTDGATRRFKSTGNRHGVVQSEGAVLVSDAVTGIFEYSNGRKRRLKKRVRSGTKTRSSWKAAGDTGEVGVDAASQQQNNKDQDSGFEPSPRISKSKIPTPRHIYTAHVPRRPIYATLDGRSCSSRLENRKPGDRGACDMNAVTRSIQRNIRRYYMERKIFQHLLELKSLQIRSNKLNEAVLVKRAVDDYHKSCAALGGETGTRLRRYNFSEYTFKNFELFLYETLKSLQKPGTYNFQNINEVYEEAERRLSPDYNAYEKALQCTTKTHRCLHAAHAYTGIPCAAYIPMMNHHTMPKFGFGPYKKTGVGSFYLPKILTTGTGCSGKVALELSHGKSKQLISLPSDKLDSNKRYYVTFTVKDSNAASTAGGGAAGAASATTSAAAASVMNPTNKTDNETADGATVSSGNATVN